MRPATANLLLIACAAIWGMSFLFQKTAMDHVPPLQFIAARCTLAALVLAPLAWMERQRAGDARTGDVVSAGMVAGAVMFVAAWLQQVGIVSASVTNSAFLTSLYVVITPFLAWAILGQQPAPTLWAAVSLSALGAWLLGGGWSAAYGLGDLAVVLATLFWALHVIALGWAAPRGSPITITAVQFAMAAVLAAPASAVLETSSLAGLEAAAGQIIYVGVLSGALTFTIFTMALRATSATAATVIASTEAPFAALGAYVVLGEKLSLVGGVGALLMVAAAIVLHLAPPRPLTAS